MRQIINKRKFKIYNYKTTPFSFQCHVYKFRHMARPKQTDRLSHTNNCERTHPFIDAIIRHALTIVEGWLGAWKGWFLLDRVVFPPSSC